LIKKKTQRPRTQQQIPIAKKLTDQLVNEVNSVIRTGEIAAARLPALERILHQVPICEGAYHFLSRMAQGAQPKPCTIPTVNHTTQQTNTLLVRGNNTQPTPLRTRPRENSFLELTWSDSIELKNLLVP